MCFVLQKLETFMKGDAAFFDRDAGCGTGTL